MKDDITCMDEEQHGSTKQERSAARVEPLVEAYVDMVGDAGDAETNLGDLLADLMHYAEERDIDWDLALGKAERHFSFEHDDLDQELQNELADGLDNEAAPPTDPPV